MAIPWISGVKTTGTLMIFNGIPGGKWATVFNDSLETFDKIRKRYGLRVKFKKSKDKDSADVVMEVSDGPVSFVYDNIEYTAAFNGKALKGKTRLVNPAKEVVKAFIYLPSQPLVNTPSGQRGVGINVMRVIAVHELIHACGLEDSDHTNDDLFYGNPVPAIGDSPNGDKLMLITKKGNIKFPPYFLSPATVSKINAIW